MRCSSCSHVCGDWPLEDYWETDHPAHVAYREGRRACLRRSMPERLRTALDGCGVLTYAFPLREVAKAYAMLADPSALAADDPRATLAPSCSTVRDAMLAHPGDGRRQSRPARYLADEGEPRSGRQQGGHGGVAWARDPPGAARGRRDERRDRAWPSRSRTATGTTAGHGRPRSRRCARQGSSKGRSFGSWGATTGRDSRPARAPGRRVDRGLRAGAGRRADLMTPARPTLSGSSG